MTQNLDRSQNSGQNPTPTAASTSASRRVGARLARRITGQRGTRLQPLLEPLGTIHREL